MNSLILRTAARYLVPLLLLYSVFLLIQGHHKPGGGFVGGLAAAAAIALSALAAGVPAARRILQVQPPRLIGGGLLVAAISGIWGLALGKPFLTGVWTKLPLPGGQSLDVGTPQLFDAGVYLVVVGATLMVLLTLAED